MNNINYKIISLSENTIQLLEKLRYNAYGMDPNSFPVEKTYHTKQLKEGKYLVFGCFLNNQLVGACYTSKTHNSLYIEQLFIKKEYQNTPLHLGTNLLIYILENKQIVEDYFQTKFNYSYLDNYKDTTNLYQSIGYHKTGTIMKKRI